LLLLLPLPLVVMKESLPADDNVLPREARREGLRHTHTHGKHLKSVTV
jgi:hypothetical protein